MDITVLEKRLNCLKYSQTLGCTACEEGYFLRENNGNPSCV